LQVQLFNENKCTVPTGFHPGDRQGNQAIFAKECIVKLKTPKVLIVDDDVPMQELIGRMLDCDGYPYVTASCGEEALEILKREEFALMISDINMPGKTGIDLLQDVHKTYINMAVLLVTAVDIRTLAVRSLHMGAFGYVIKPFSRNELIINVNNALWRRELEIKNRMHSDELERLVSARTEELEHSRTETIQKLGRAAEFRDNETAQHTIRMGHYCQILAQSTGQSKEFSKKIKIAGQLHDVGKIGIPDAILFKSGKLTSNEFDTIKKHTVIGYRILVDSKSEVLNLGAVIALTHHEKFNGGGYPGGLREYAIPLAGRIAAICDVFDALTSRRVYKFAISVEVALDILRQERGEHFDPELIDLFFKNIKKIMSVKDEFKDHQITAEMKVA